MRKGRSLKYKLRQSVLLTTGLSLLLLVLALVLIAWLGRNALQLARVGAPTVLHTTVLQMGVQQSQQDLLGWVTMGDREARNRRKKAWSEEIIPALNGLLELSRSWSTEERAALLETRDKIYQLEAYQWWVEDSAGSAGNEPAVHLFSTRVQEILDSLSSDVTALTGLQIESADAIDRRQLIGILSDLRGSSAAASAEFARFLVEHDQEAIAGYRDHLRVAERALVSLRDQAGALPDEERRIVERIDSKLRAFEKRLAEARFVAQSRQVDQAEFVVAEHVNPTIEIIKSRLAKVKERELAALMADAESVEGFVWLAIIGLPLFMAATGFVAVRNAKQFNAEIVSPIADLVTVAQAVNEGDYELPPPVRSDDEIGLLSAAFKSMIDSFAEITDVAIAVAQGDFSQRLEVTHSRDRLRNAINAMNSKLVEIKDQAKLIAHGDYSTDFVPMSAQDELGCALQLMTTNLRESTALLASSEARSTAVIRTAQDGIITLGEDRTIHSFNPAAERMFGYRADEIVGHSFSKLIAENPQGPANRHESGEQRQHGNGRELTGRRKDGKSFPMLLSVGEAVVEEKRLFAGIVRDLSEELAAREELKRYLKEQEDQNWFKSQLSRIYDSSQGITEPKLLCKTMLSELAEQLQLGQALFYCVEEREGEEDELRLYASYGHHESEAFPQALGFGESLIGECAQQKSPILLSPVPEGFLRIGSGLGEATPHEVVFLPVLFERHLLGVMELAVFNPLSPIQRDYLAQVVRTIGAILKGVIEQRRTEELLLVTQEQSEGLQVQQEELRVSNEELKRQTDQLQASEEELRVQQVELAEANAQLKESAQDLESRNELLNARNEELEAAREAIRLKAEELENASKYKSEFLANMSHELRTPLNSILVLAKLLRENKQKTLDTKQEKFAEVIFQSGNDLLALINEILDLSKIEAGMLELSYADVPIGEIAQSIDDLFREVSRSKQLNFVVEVAEDCPEALQTDKSRLEQVIKNLISNAFKFTPPGGQVDFSVQPVSDRSELRSDTLRGAEVVLALAVKDSGIGIPANKHDAVFESFQQADGSTSRKYGGTGLGLSISRELVEHMGGEIHLWSEEGKGSIFTVYLPAGRCDLEAGTGSLEEESGAAGDAGEEDGSEKPAGAVGATPVEQPAPQPAGPAAEVPGARQENGRAAANGNGRLGSDHGAELSRDAAQAAPSPPERKVLVIEDDEKQNFAVRELLEGRGFVTTAAHTGKEALQCLAGGCVELIVLDLGLPDISGLDLLDRIRENEATKEVPVIVLTGREVEVEEAARIGRHAGSIVLKTENSDKRLIDETALCLKALEEDGHVAKRSRGRAANSRHVLNARTVLVVDDDERNICALRSLLQEHQMNVLVGRNGREGLEVLAENPNTDIVLMDVMMPVMDGYEAIKQIRAQPRFSTLPVLAVTAKSMKGDRESALQAGASDYISKPIDSERLLTLVSVWLYQ